MTLLFVSLQLAYTFCTFLLWWAWERTPACADKPEAEPTLAVTVVVVVRDEARNLPALLDSLSAQSYPAHLFEVLVVDDHSTDGTPACVRRYAARFVLRLLELAHHPGGRPADGSFKKQAIEWAVAQATGDLVVTTDGDCTVPPDWLALLAAAYRRTGAAMVCGPVAFSPPQATVFSSLQTVEFASLIGSGAATLHLGLPTLCNAANLAFSRRAFGEVGGYRDTAGTATGDDLFLMHKLHAAHPQGVRFAKHRQVVVRTPPPASLQEFLQQRRRWASKWHLYRDRRVSAVAVGVFMANAGLLAGLGATLVGLMPPGTLFVPILLRWVAEFGFLSRVLYFLGRPRAVAWIVPVQVVYPFYVVFIGLVVQRKGYGWKGRRLQ